jgi:hypothetical protein
MAALYRPATEPDRGPTEPPQSLRRGLEEVPDADHEGLSSPAEDPVMSAL